MIKFFSKGFFIQYAMVFLIGLVFWLPAFLNKPVIAQPNIYWGPLSAYFYQLFSFLGIAGTIAAYLIIYGTGLITNHLAGYYSVADKTGTLPLFLFVIISSFIPALTTLSLFTLIVPWIILLMVILFKHAEKNDNIIPSFDAGLLTGILTLFYFPLLWLILLVWLAFITFKSTSWRNFTVSILGLFFPALVFYAFLLFTGNEAVFFEGLGNLFHGDINFSLLSLKGSTILTYLVPVLVLLSALKVMHQQTNLTISQRSYLFVLGMYVIIVFIIMLFFSTGFSAILLLAPAGAVTLSNLIISSVKPKWTNIAFIVLLMAYLSFSWLTFYYAAQ